MAQKILHYDVLERLGEGARSTIWAVSDPDTKQVFALKHVVRADHKDLRFIEPQSHTDFSEIVLGGKFRDKGMVPFNGVLTQEQVDAVHSYVIARGQEDWQPVFLPQPPRR